MFSSTILLSHAMSVKGDFDPGAIEISEKAISTYLNSDLNSLLEYVNLFWQFAFLKLPFLH